ncbi:MAG: hypothetical protein MSH34_08440 [Oscillospiraceae bacterium]|nr:hypothetical protein [Oscillospiraceae bacterium]
MKSDEKHTKKMQTFKNRKQLNNRPSAPNRRAVFFCKGAKIKKAAPPFGNAAKSLFKN